MKVKDRPLSSAALHILLALAESNLHGYGIMQSVKRQSGGNYKLGPGTLYANLDRLLGSGLVGESERRLKSGDTRREYCLTPSGEQVLRLEVRRLRQVVDTARTRLGKLDGRGASVRDSACYGLTAVCCCCIPRRSENVLRWRCWSWQKQLNLGNGR